MLKTVLAFVMMFYAAFCFATVDANKASAAELDSVKGIGPALSTRIIDERAKGQFKDWADFIGRVKGLGEGNAAKLSAQGLTVGGAGFRGTTPTTAAKREGKPAAPAAKTDEKPTAASTMVGKADDKASKSAPAAAPASAASAAKK